MKNSFTLSATFPTTPETLYNAWLDSETHTAMTGGETATCNPEVGGSFTAWDGYIEGENLELEPGKRIVQAWRTTAFQESDPDSKLEILFEPVPIGTKLRLNHSNIPDGGADYEKGWEDYYFVPMREFFGK